MPEVIIVDEIGNENDALAARTIAERGVQLIGTAHGNTLDNLAANPTLSDLIGGIQAVTLGDDEARKRGTQKTVLERKAPPTFHTLIEIMDPDRLAIHHDIARTVDAMLLGAMPKAEVRERASGGEVEIVQPAGEAPPPPERTPPERAPLAGTRRTQSTQVRNPRILLVGVSRSKAEKAIRELRVPARITRNEHKADMVLSLRNAHRQHQGRPPGRPDAKQIAIRGNSYGQIYAALRECFDVDGTAREELALREVEEALRQVLRSREAVELTPQNAYVRRLQHELAARHDLRSDSVGRDPRRRVRILPQA